jgi:signal transduction histidine kinase
MYEEAFYDTCMIFGKRGIYQGNVEEVYYCENGIFYYKLSDGWVVPVQSVAMNFVLGQEKWECRFAYDAENGNYYVENISSADGVTENPETAAQTDSGEAQTDGAAEQVEIAVLTDTDEIQILELLGSGENITFDRFDDTEAAVLSEKHTVSLDEVAYGYGQDSEDSFLFLTKDDLEDIKSQRKLLSSSYTFQQKQNEKGIVCMDTTNGEGEIGNLWVVSLLPQNLETQFAWSRYDRINDRYALVLAANNFLYRYRYPAIILFAVSVLFGLTLFVLLGCSAGHRKGKEGITLTWVQRIPLEVEWAAVLLAEVLGFAAAEILIEEVMIRSYYETSLKFTMGIFVGIASLVEAALAISCLLSLLVRIKAGKWWRNTVIYRALHLIVRCGKKIMQALFVRAEKAAGTLHENFSLLFKAGVILTLLAVLEFSVIVTTNYDTDVEIFFWLIEKVVLYGGILAALLQMKKLQEGGRCIAEGDTTHQIDTKKMFWEFKKHGENLNSIGTGIQLAVEERMKSERFKTELITNVSHDIKTPLTSIINYVDLLGKEELNNPKAAEYLEVLGRQSERLKKLIEDLMEASKASTGNLAVNLERLEAGVFMVQTVGEFEEKTKAAGLELIIKKPENPVYIMADGRHFWRVIDNLMNNICKYAQPGTRVYIDLTIVGGEALLTFRNTSRYALNISSEELLERFVRGDSSRNTEGSGLGLSIAESLMELMNAKMELYVDGDLFKVVLRFALT